MSRESRVLVTGASGYIATHIVQQLQKLDYQVRGTVRSKSNEEKVKPLLSLCPNAKYPLELVEADLTSPNGWLDAIQGCTFVMHVASPFPAAQPVNEQEVIGPAVDGTMHVMRACKEAGCVKRVVLTSSMAAISGEVASADHMYTEEDWTDVSVCSSAYYKSKALAERAAWDFVADLPRDQQFELATINPGFVMGPVLCGSSGTSMEVMRRILRREMPLLPRMNMPSVDVRDVAAAHIAALTNPDACGKRHITVNTNLWWSDIASVLRKEFKHQGYNIPTTNAPYWMMWIMGRFDRSVRWILPQLGVTFKLNNTRLTEVLGVQPRPIEETIIEMAYSMIENGAVKKTSKYTGPTSPSA